MNTCCCLQLYIVQSDVVKTWVYLLTRTLLPCPVVGIGNVLPIDGYGSMHVIPEQVVLSLFYNMSMAGHSLWIIIMGIHIISPWIHGTNMGTSQSRLRKVKPSLVNKVCGNVMVTKSKTKRRNKREGQT